MGWDLIDPALDPDPVVGEPDQFLDLVHRLDDVNEAVQAIAARTQALFGSVDDGWLGAGAEAFAGRAARVTAALAETGPALAAAAAASARHATALADLHVRAQAELAIARDRYAQHRQATALLDAARYAAAAAQRHLAAVRSDAQPGPELAVAEARWTARRGDVVRVGLRVAALDEELAASRSAHAALAAGAAELSAATRAAIDAASASLRPLELGGASGGVGPLAFVAGIGSAVADMADRVLGGALGQLSGALLDQLVPFGFGGELVASWAEALSDLPAERKLAVVAVLVDLHATLTRGDRDGDLGGTFDWSPRGAWAARAQGLPGVEPSTRGSRLVAAALRITDGARWLAPDEFGVIALDAGGYVVVLPGVTDLSNPGVGLNSRHRTVRDLDRAALGSSLSTGMADNPYARMVAEGLDRFGVEPGSEIAIVGHSFGADTALDLAADPAFNGRYAVTHVVAAGYHSVPQLPFVPSATEVLVLQNDHDWVIDLERFGEHPVAAAHALGDAWGALGDIDPIGLAGALTSTSRHAGEFGLYLGEQGVSATGGIPPLVSVPGWPSGGRRVGDRVATPTEQQTVAVFDGGDAGWGHHQRNYVEYVERQSDRDVSAFTAGLDRAGYTGAGHVYAIDVSVPDDRPRGSW